ncbi:PhnB protein [Aliiruegeria haliotis]|uniref:PhnB protein n=1 Tax=Aliiruegeria haliotis TaxID=1280846 RepID=A0A2T0RN86_9RHOB|nr:VOC family protein [Aliiruegeria haliotis]PRY22618.1 PhnB protein [Aliiruegeria haliotis]
MNPTPYVMFENGQCREAMGFYADVFGGEIEAMIPASEGPMELPPEKDGWLMHAAVEFDQGLLMGCDDVMGGFDPMTGSSIMMAVETVARGREIFEALAEGGAISTPFQETFFSPGFGTVRDRFGINWMISCTAPVEAS